MVRQLLLGGIMFLLLAGAWVRAQVPPPGLPAFRHKAIVIDYRNLKYNPCNDAMFPCVIEAAKYFKKPLARFYMYYAPHNPPGGICLATADSPAGPWKEYAANPVITNNWAPHYKVSHVCSAHALWNEEERQLFIYFHGENNITRYATTTDGIHCAYGGVAVTAAMFGGINEASYGRVFRHEIPGTGSRYILLFMGNNQGTRRIYLAWSRDGRQWTARRTALIDPPPGTSQVASPFFFEWHGKAYVIYHGEEATKDPNRPHCNLYVSEVDAALEHPRLLGKFFDRASLSPTNGRAADGDIIEADGKLWLYYSTDERLNQRIAVAERIDRTTTATATANSTNDPFTVRPIDWSRFAKPAPASADLESCGRILLNTARYGAAWITKTYSLSERGDRYLVPNENVENTIRMPASVAYGLAVVLKMGLFDEQSMGVSRAELTHRVARLIKGVAAIHNTNPGGRWGDHWQSAVWSGLLADAAWLLWDDLDAETRAMVIAMTVHEADRHIASDYTIPYWNGKGGDTKAEENAWETMILQAAVAMLPDHPHARQWRAACSELLVSAFARQSDLGRTDVTLDGKTPHDWLKGFNIREDGTLFNHNIIHNDYMSCIELSLRTLLFCSLAGIPAPQSFDFNAAVVYGAFQKVRFPAPPYQAPGGTMFIPGQPGQYYPNGTDWSRFRFDIYYLCDLYADILGFDRGLEHKAREWMPLRTATMLKMQARFSDGRMYDAPREFKTYKGAEQMALWVMADAWLLQWLNAREALSHKANWLE